MTPPVPSPTSRPPDPASLRVIEFVASELDRTRVLLVVTVRPVTGEANADEADGVIQGQLPPLIDTWMTVGVLAGAAYTRAVLGDLEGARVLRQHLCPYQGRLATVGTGPAFGDVHGSLAAVARALGEVDDAVRHADASVEVLTRAGAGPFLARALLRRADLRPETAAADREAATALIERDDLRLLRRQLAAR
jgi:hypothetical protein